MKLSSTSLFLIFCFCANTAAACRCDFEPLNVVLKDPTKAGTAFTALFKENNLEIKKNWKPIPSAKIKTESSWPGHVTKCDLTLEPDQEYLILSPQKSKEPISLNICSTAAIKLKDAEELIKKLNSETNLNKKSK